MENDFDGVFKFSNPTDEDFSVLWNNEEFIFPANSMVPLIMPKEPLENVQEIRKKFAYKLAVREFYKGKEYKRMSKMGNGLPPTYDDKILEPMIEQCLKSLPMSKAKTRKIKGDNDSKFKGSKAIGDKENLAYAFKDDEAKALGAMPDRPIS